jgi:F420-dependent oxidoreductase-like protein
MKLAMAVNYAGDPLDAATQARELETRGVDLAWGAELYSFDAVSILGYLAASTERLELMAGILPIYSRTPTLTAMTAAGLDAVSRGRFMLGLGASGPQVIEGWHGVRYDKPLGRTREIVEICRKVRARERLTHDGPIYLLPLPEGQGTGMGKALKIINHPVRPDIPIFVASLGPKNVELTAEVADGWLPIFFHPEKAHEVWGDALTAGVSRRSAELGPLETIAGGTLAFCDDDNEAKRLRDATRPLVALYVGGMGARGKNFYNDIFVRYGYAAEAAKMQDAYLDHRQADAAELIPRRVPGQLQPHRRRGLHPRPGRGLPRRRRRLLAGHPCGARPPRRRGPTARDPRLTQEERDMSPTPTPMERCLDQWHEFLRSGDVDMLDDLLDDDCVFISPIVFTPQQGKDITKLYLTAAGATLAGTTDAGLSGPGNGGGFRYVRTVRDGKDAVLEFETTLNGKYVNGVDMITCNDDGRIVDFKVMIRPLQAINAVHEQMRAALKRMS